MTPLLPYSRKRQMGSALILSIMITFVIMIIGLYLLDKIIPFSREARGVENSNMAYYRASSAVNEALLSMSAATPGMEASTGTVTNGLGTTYNIIAKGTIIPRPGQGSSEYDKNWGIIAPGKPIQLSLPSDITVDWIASEFSFRVPDLKSDFTHGSLAGAVTTPVINWTLSSSGETLISDGSQLMISDVNGVVGVKLSGLSGRDLLGNTSLFNVFYTNKCLGIEKCTLKFAIVNPLLLIDGVTTAPYLEYQANLASGIPLQIATIEASGYVGGFRQNITKYVQQTTTNEALDFTVFQ